MGKNVSRMSAKFITFWNVRESLCDVANELKRNACLSVYSLPVSFFHSFRVINSVYSLSLPEFGEIK